MDPFVAEIRLFPFNFAPRGWALCNGQLLPIAQNTALFSLLGTTYGGDGRRTFALPDLRGCAPMHPGVGTGLSPHVLGESGGTASVALTVDELPAHTHPLSASTHVGLSKSPAPSVALARSGSGSAYQTAPGGLVPLGPLSVAASGGGQPHNNLQPYLTFNFCIALQGVFPPRS